MGRTISFWSMDGDDSADRTREELRERELEQEQASREAAKEADTVEETRINLRRAEKAHYLGEKLEQQARADEEADRGGG